MTASSEPDTIVTPDPEPARDPEPATTSGFPEPEVEQHIDPANAPAPEGNPHFEEAPTGDTPDLPEGTAYVTPDGVVGVVGYGDPSGMARPLQGAPIEALFTFAHAVRTESTYH